MRKSSLLFIIVICFIFVSQSFSQTIVPKNKNEQKLQFVSLNNIMTDQEINKNTDENGIINIEKIKTAVLKAGKGYIKNNQINNIIETISFYPAPDQKIILIGEHPKYIATTKDNYLEKVYQYGDVYGLDKNEKNDLVILVATE
jgi:hypothetical protein